MITCHGNVKPTRDLARVRLVRKYIRCVIKHTLLRFCSKRRQGEMLRDQREIRVSMQKRRVVLHGYGGDQTVDGTSDRQAPFPQAPVDIGRPQIIGEPALDLRK